MSNKHDFSIAMHKLKLPSISGHYLSQADRKATKKLLFNGQSLFIKPVCGSRKVGCFELNYCVNSDTYQLRSNTDVVASTKTEINNVMLQQIEREEYLLQPLLTNHPLLEQQFNCLNLITIRLITALINQQHTILSAVLECPIDNQFQQIDIYTIDIETGYVHCQQLKTIHQIIERKLTPFELPNWLDVQAIGLRAHQGFKDIKMIGWDLALTETGVRLIEGNINWAVKPHQTDKAIFSKL